MPLPNWTSIWILLMMLPVAAIRCPANDESATQSILNPTNILPSADPSSDSGLSRFTDPPKFTSSVFDSEPKPAEYPREPFPSADFCVDPPRVISVFYGYDSWRGHPDGAWANNGLHTGIHTGFRLGSLSERTGIGAQISGSVGVYNWAGTDYKMANQDQATTQGFLTFGFFRRADEDSNWSAGIVQDWMINHNYSVMAEDSTMYQWRAQLGYAMGDRDEIGVWGAIRGQGDTKVVPVFGAVTWQPVNQASLFWHRKWFETQADTWISIGVPEHDRLTGSGSLGDWVVGAWGTCPLSSRLAIYSMVNYMHQSSSPGPVAATEDAWNFYVGISFYPGRLAQCMSVRGHRYSPLLPLANNGLFLVDASQTY